MSLVITDPAVTAADAALLHEGAALVTTNPFEERWLAIQRRLLGDTYQETGRVLALVGDHALPNLGRVQQLLRPMHARVRARLRAGASATAEELGAYAEVSFLLLYLGFETELSEVADSGLANGELFARFRANHKVMFDLPGVHLDVPPPRVLLEVCYQARRAFHILHTTLRGISPEAGKLRARVWNARFPGGDLMKYARGGQARQASAHTLILGDTGTGKELVARALAYARHIPYSEADRAFTGRAAEGFHVVNTSGLPVDIADSLLFGHRKGAFTGADRDALGVLAKCVTGDVLFLDEFGDLAPEVQVKLLRVVEERKYTPVGAAEARTLGGTLLFAAQPALFRGRGFRQDMRHRLYEHVIRLPPLRARFDSDPGELPFLVRLFATAVAGPAEADRLTAEVLRIVETRFKDYRWAGNLRELKGCVSNVYEQRDYEPPSGYDVSSAASSRSTSPSAPAAGRPPSDGEPEGTPAAAPPAPPPPGADLARAVLEGSITMDDLRRRYILHAHTQAGTYTETAKRLQVDWRTVRTVVEEEKLMARVRAWREAREAGAPLDRAASEASPKADLDSVAQGAARSAGPPTAGAARLPPR